METIAVVNRKGGSGKTTTALAIADYLSFKGKKVLVIDMDTQCNATKTYNIFESCKVENLKSLFDIIVNNVPIMNAIVPVDSSYFTDDRVKYSCCAEDRNALHDINIASRFRYGVDIIPANTKIGETLKNEMRFNAEQQLLNRLADIPAGKYDYIILDTVPGEDVILFNALMAADHIIVTHMLEESSYDGISKIQNILTALGKSFSTKENPVEFKISGIAVLNVDLVTSKKENLKQIENLKEYCAAHGNIKIFKHMIRSHPIIKTLRSNHFTLFNMKMIESKVLSTGIDNDDEALTLDKLYTNRKEYTKNEKGKVVKRKKIDFPSVAKDYIGLIREILEDIE